MYQKLLKRLLDFFLSIIGLVVISPILLIVWVLLIVANGGALFVHWWASSAGKCPEGGYVPGGTSAFAGTVPSALFREAGEGVQHI